VRRAWELGAGMDSWWESLETAFKAWTQAIDEADLTWKYRQVDQGEWNVMDTDGAERAPSLDAPLPWDHLDTGIDKTWLQEDLQRALEAAVVPDCSFEGCSHCGVCGPDFGHNIVVPPLPIPAFAGHGQPSQERVQRLRVTLGKLGSMALIGHLDLVRLFDRALRRADLPIAFSGGFHPGPRVSPANALPLGATSSGEVVDFELTEAIAPADFLNRLAAELPSEIPLYAVVEVPLTEPSATKSLDRAEYYLHLGPEEESPCSWEQWIQAVLALEEVPWEKKTKSGATQVINLRQRLHELDRVPSDRPLPPGLEYDREYTGTWLRVIGSCRNDGNLLRPEHVLKMMEQVAGQPLKLNHAHRSQLIFVQPIPLGEGSPWVQPTAN
jgi:radical SAM-linked protein